MSLYIVATPIGNLEDISQRALKILSAVTLIAAEDTRHSRVLLQNFGIRTPLVAYHDHNESNATNSLMEKLIAGDDIALISDAGTPLISDPGYRIVKRAQENGIEVIPIPGASALIAALSVAGLPTDRFHFEGFLASKSVGRRSRLKELQNLSSTLIFYEGPHRIEATLSDLALVLGESRLGTISREMTKRYEQISYGSLAELLEKVQSGEIPARGEFVVVVEGGEESTGNFDNEYLMSILIEELPPRKAAGIAHKLTGVSKKQLYEVALKLKGK
ncbi:MAG: 16S rRNA (cytidine1402-2'-O)-methyltransferase [Candidatus Azotimanducaceae bacterium]